MEAIGIMKKRTWFSCCTGGASMLLPNPLYAAAGLPSPFGGGPAAHPLAAIALALISFSGVRYVMEGILDHTVGKLLPRYFYVIEKEPSAEE